MANSAYAGVEEATLADITDLETMKYSEVLKVKGMVSLSADAQTSDEATYADNGEWISDAQDNGFDGSIVFKDPWSDKETRRFIAEHIGYEMLENGNIEKIADGLKKPFAFGCKETGVNAGAKRWMYFCEFGKPSVSPTTNTDSKQWRDIELPFKAKPIKLPNGKVSSGLTAFKGDANYDTFLDAAPTFTTTTKTTGE